MALDQLVFDSESDGEDIRRPLARNNKDGDEGEEGEDDGRDISEAEEAPEKDAKKKDDAEDGGKIQPTKIRRSRPKLTEDHLIGAKGLDRIYETFPNLCRFRGAGHEAEDLRNLLRRYMEWAYQLFPNLAFEDFLPALQKLSGKARVRRAIEDLREKQRQKYLERKFGDDYQEKLEAYDRKRAELEQQKEEEARKRREEARRQLIASRRALLAATMPEGEEEIEDLGAVDQAALERKRREEEEEEALRVAEEDRRRRAEERAAQGLPEESEEEKEEEEKDKDKSGDKESEDGRGKKKRGRKPAAPPSRRRRRGASPSSSSSSSSSEAESDGAAEKGKGPKKAPARSKKAPAKTDRNKNTGRNKRAKKTPPPPKPSTAASDSDDLVISSSEDEDDGVPVSRPQVTGYLHVLLSELSLETATLKVVLQRVREHFQLNDQHMATLKPIIKGVVIDITTAKMSQRRDDPPTPEQQQGDEEADEMEDMLLDDEVGSQEPAPASPAEEEDASLGLDDSMAPGTAMAGVEESYVLETTSSQQEEDKEEEGASESLNQPSSEEVGMAGVEESVAVQESAAGDDEQTAGMDEAGSAMAGVEASVPPTAMEDREEEEDSLLD